LHHQKRIVQTSPYADMVYSIFLFVHFFSSSSSSYDSPHSSYMVFRLRHRRPLYDLKTEIPSGGRGSDRDLLISHPDVCPGSRKENTFPLHPFLESLVQQRCFHPILLSGLRAAYHCGFIGAGRNNILVMKIKK